MLKVSGVSFMPFYWKFIFTNSTKCFKSLYVWGTVLWYALYPLSYFILTHKAVSTVIILFDKQAGSGNRMPDHTICTGRWDSNPGLSDATALMPPHQHIWASQPLRTKWLFDENTTLHFTNGVQLLLLLLRTAMVAGTIYHFPAQACALYLAASCRVPSALSVQHIHPFCF